MRFKSFIIGICWLISSVSIFSQQTSLFEKKQFIQNRDTLNYRIMYPKNFSKEKEYPVVLFLHGSGERGNDNELQMVHGSTLFSKKENREQFPAIVLFPQCPEDDYWSNFEVDRSSFPILLNSKYNEPPTKALQQVIALLEEITTKSYVNKNQLYVMGLSMGGMGTFELVYRKPNLFAAAIPICGAGDPEYVNEYAKSTPIWVFHGAKDTIVNPLQSVEMVSAILKAGGFPKFTLYDKANHNSWDNAFAEKDLLQWLFSQKLNK